MRTFCNVLALTTLCSAMQIRLYFPETGHPAYGVLRAQVKDSNNTVRGTSHVDSDGRVGYEYNHNDVDSKPLCPHFLAEGLWHMATLTTLTKNSSGLRGYAMLLDGQPVGLQAADLFYTSEQTYCLAA